MNTAERVTAIMGRSSLDGLRERLGECYRYAGQRVMDNLGAVLVHGTIRIAGRPIKHAWVSEPDGMVWDPTTDSFWTPSEYAQVFGAVERVVYTRERALALALSLCHFGPWDDYPDYDDEWHPRAMADTEGL